MYTSSKVRGTLWHWRKGACLVLFLPIGRRQFTKVENSVSSNYSLRLGIPQGFILGPLLYTLCTSPLGDIARRHDLTFHFYADDTQLYIAFNSLDSADVSLRKLILKAYVNEINLQYYWSNMHNLSKTYIYHAFYGSESESSWKVIQGQHYQHWLCVHFNQ